MDADGIWAQLSFPDCSRFAGHRFINSTSLGLPSVWTDHWEPLRDAADETGTVVCLHIGSSSKLITSSDDAPACTVVTDAAPTRRSPAPTGCSAGSSTRHPRIRVAFSEGGARWVPYLLEQADHIFTGCQVEIPARVPPRQVFAEHMSVCFLRDTTAMAALDVIPVDDITWRSKTSQ